MAIREMITREVHRLPDLRNRPRFREPWKLQREGSHWWRIDEGGMIYRVEIPSGIVRRF